LKVSIRKKGGHSQKKKEISYLRRRGSKPRLAPQEAFTKKLLLGSTTQGGGPPSGEGGVPEKRKGKIHPGTGFGKSLQCGKKRGKGL